MAPEAKLTAIKTRSLDLPTPTQAALPRPKPPVGPKSAPKPPPAPNFDQNPPLVTGSIGVVAIKNEVTPSTELPNISRVTALPEPSQRRFAVSGQHKGRAIDATAELDWRHDGQTFDAQLAVGQWFGAPRHSRSSGAVGENGLSPTRYSESAVPLLGRGNGGERAVHINQAQGRVSYSNNRADAPWVDGMQDPLSVIVQLTAWLAGDATSFRPGSRFSVPATGLANASQWVFGVEGVAQTDLPGVASAQALKFSRELRGEYDARLELWFAKAPDWQLARMRVTRASGDWIDLISKQ